MFWIMFVAIILALVAFFVVYYLVTRKTKYKKEFAMLVGGAVGLVVLWAYTTIMLFRSIQQMFG